MRNACVVTVLLVLSAAASPAQRMSMPPVAIRSNSIGIMGGWAIPQSHEGLTKFWGPGPTASLEFLRAVSRGVSLGFGVDAAAYWFRGPAFVAAYPTLPFRNPPVAQIVAGVIARFTLVPGKRLSPYIGALLGLSHMTGAEYRQQTDSTTTTYYYIPFETRLAAGLSAGIEFRASRALAFDVEGRALYVNNDPDVGATAQVRGGLRLIF